MIIANDGADCWTAPPLNGPNTLANGPTACAGTAIKPGGTGSHNGIATSVGLAGNDGRIGSADLSGMLTSALTLVGNAGAIPSTGCARR